MRTRVSSFRTPSTSSPTADRDLARLSRLPQRRLAGDLIVYEAATLRSQLLGLGGLDALAPGCGLEIATASVHTFTMRFALDLIWLSGDGHVRGVDRDVPRRRVVMRRGARAVIETAAGQADAFVAALEGGSAPGG